MSAVEFVIETGTPIPSVGAGRPRGSHSPHVAAALGMEVGQCIFFKTTRRNFPAPVRAAGRKIGMKFTSRQVDGGYRVWRTA